MDTKLEKIIDKSFDSIVRLSPLPDLAEEAIILGKNVITNKEAVESFKKIFENALNNNGQINENFNKIADIFVNELLENKQLNKDISSVIEEGKEELKNVNELSNQEISINELNSAYDKWNEYFKIGDVKNMDIQYKNIIECLNNVKITEDILEKSYGIKEMNELMKNKIKEGNYEISDSEKELCRNIG